MIKNLDFLGKPSREKINLFVGLGTSLFVLGMIDLLLNSFYRVNLTSFLPRALNYFTPLIFCFLGLYYIRIDFSGNRTLDNLNKKLNSNWFNSLLSILIIFSLVSYSNKLSPILIPSISKSLISSAWDGVIKNKPRTKIPKSFFIIKCYQKTYKLTI